ncbi:MAG: hypothetical protein QXK71_02145 [Pyrobaculum sp.]|jgi:hypothetical protein
MTSFYDFLWEAVRNPELIIHYANEVGISPPPPPIDFYDRLEYVAVWTVEILKIEKDDTIYWNSRCREAKRFFLDALEDLKAAGKLLRNFDLC